MSIISKFQQMNDRMRMFLLLTIILITCPTKAQRNGAFLAFDAGYGMNQRSYQLLNGSVDTKSGVTLNSSFGYFFNKHLGLRTGVGIQTFNSISNVNFMESQPMFDSEGDLFEHRTYYSGLVEDASLVFLDLPLIGMFRLPIGKKFNLLLSAGAKFQIPISTEYSSKGIITTTGYFSQWDVELTDLPQYGFQSSQVDYKGAYTLKKTWTGLAELGGLYQLSARKSMYAGVYFNYGLSNILNPSALPIMQLDGTYSGILNSTQTNRLEVNSVGLKIGLFLFK